MSVVIVVALLMGFSLCVVVGLVTVLQSLSNQDLRDESRGSILQDHPADH